MLLVRHVLPFLGDKSLDKIYEYDVELLLQASRTKGLAPASCNRILALVRTVFNCAVRWNLLAKNPCAGVAAFSGAAVRDRYLTNKEMEAVVAELEARAERGLGARALQLLLYTGARKREILTARWENVDLEKRMIIVPNSKSGKTRYIPLSDEAVRIIANIPRPIWSPWLFENPLTGKALRSVYDVWDSVRKKLLLENVRIHDLRHSFASHLVNAGNSLYVVQRILGHQSPSVTMRYAHLDQEALLKAANMMPTFPASWSKAEKVGIITSSPKK